MLTFPAFFRAKWYLGFFEILIGGFLGREKLKTSIFKLGTLRSEDATAAKTPLKSKFAFFRLSCD